MSKESYRQLLGHICSQANLTDTESVYASGNIVVNDIPFTLIHDENGDDDGLRMYCDFGKPAPERRALALQRLLETNLYMFSAAGAPSFGFNQENGRVVMMARMALSQVSAASLLRAMGEFSSYAAQWREKYFLLDTEHEAGNSAVHANARNAGAALIRRALSAAATDAPAGG
ncbi:CesT family type III secretion system chaperone [Collimonas sp.]|jgi:hypothetical protein|uniref:CesT family type III secretion system chaperone n=1 Tax=Collimonas sp. TaxID=1963772 RepID=UPI002BAE5109|nr:CesT family type III secretion system chaperone [Collimonas sp.]HWW08250.1 CesT family type III secretion system chaperone [Collimonas sp.]